MAKYYSSEIAVKVSTDAVQILVATDTVKIFLLNGFIEILNYVLLVKDFRNSKNGYFKANFKITSCK